MHLQTIQVTSGYRKLSHSSENQKRKRICIFRKVQCSRFPWYAGLWCPASMFFFICTEKKEFSSAFVSSCGNTRNGHHDRLTQHAVHRTSTAGCDSPANYSRGCDFHLFQQRPVDGKDHKPFASRKRRCVAKFFWSHGRDRDVKALLQNKWMMFAGLHGRRK